MATMSSNSDAMTDSTHRSQGSTAMKLVFAVLVVLSVSISVSVFIVVNQSGSKSDSSDDLTTAIDTQEQTAINSGKESSTKIINGGEAQAFRYKYAVSLQNDAHFCGGSLVAPDMVLTAAHCQQGGSYSAVIGTHSLSLNNGESIPVMSETPHPAYDETTTNADFMLLRLEWSTTMDFPLIKLNADQSIPSIGEDLTVMGWGDMTFDDETVENPDVLMSVEVKFVSNQECNDPSLYNGSITDYMMCAGGDGRDSCQGDSGGPLIRQGSKADGTDDVEIGVVSWGMGCGSPGTPGVYARISQSYDWVQNEVCNQSSNPPDYFLCGTSVPDTAIEGGTSVPATTIEGGTSVPATTLEGGTSIPATTLEGGSSIPATATVIDDELATYDDGIATNSNGLFSYDDGLASYDDGVASYDDGVASYDDGLASYDDGIASYDDGLASYDDGLASYDDGLPSYDDGLPSYDDGLPSYDDGLVTYDDGLA